VDFATSPSLPGLMRWRATLVKKIFWRNPGRKPASSASARARDSFPSVDFPPPSHSTILSSRARALSHLGCRIAPHIFVAVVRVDPCAHATEATIASSSCPKASRNCSNFRRRPQDGIENLLKLPSSEWVAKKGGGAREFFVAGLRAPEHARAPGQRVRAPSVRRALRRTEKRRLPMGKRARRY